MRHMGWVWKTRAAALLALGVACLPVAVHAEADAVMRAERTSNYDVVLTIGPAQAMSPMMQSSPGTDMAMSPGMSMGGHDMSMAPQQADQGMAVNHWLDVHVAVADTGAAVADAMPIVRIVDKSTGETRDLPSVMRMNGGMIANDFHYGQNVFLPDGTYQVSVLLGPTDTAQFRDVVVASAMMDPAMTMSMGAGHDMSMTDQTGAHP